MGADADHHQPRLAVLGRAVIVARRRVFGQIGVARQRIGQIVDGELLGLGDLLIGAVADEDRLAAPHHGDRLAGLDMGDVDLGGGHRQRRGVGVHLVEQRPQRRGGADGGKAAGRDQQDIAPARLVVADERRI